MGTYCIENGYLASSNSLMKVSALHGIKTELFILVIKTMFQKPQDVALRIFYVIHLPAHKAYMPSKPREIAL